MLRNRERKTSPLRPPPDREEVDDLEEDRVRPPLARRTVATSSARPGRKRSSPIRSSGPLGTSRMPVASTTIAPGSPRAKRSYQSSTSGVTKPSSVARHGTIAGTQVRSARRSRPDLDRLEPARRRGLLRGRPGRLRQRVPDALGRLPHRKSSGEKVRGHDLSRPLTTFRRAGPQLARRRWRQGPDQAARRLRSDEERRARESQSEQCQLPSLPRVGISMIDGAPICSGHRLALRTICMFAKPSRAGRRRDDCAAGRGLKVGRSDSRRGCSSP